MTKRVGSGLFKAFLDAIHGEDERIAGQPITRLRVGLDEADATIQVVSTNGFGEFTDGTGDARVVIGGEIIDCSGRTSDTFTGLTRGVQSTITPERHAANAIVYDLSQNVSYLDWLRRGFLVRFALGEDLTVIGSNLGMHRCPGVDDDTHREIIQQIAYLAKQTPNAVITALTALQGAGNFDFYERLVSDPWTILVDLDITLTNALQGHFFLNSGERHTTSGGQVVVDHDVVASPFDGAPARGNIRVITGANLVDGETFTLDDGPHAATVFEFDSNASVVEGPFLRAVNFTASDTEQTVRDAVITAITNAPNLDITASIEDERNVALVNDAVGVAGNVAGSDTVVDTVFAVTGMSGGQDSGTLGVFGVFPDTPLTRGGHREGVTNYFTGGSFASATITLGTNPGDGVAVIVDYNAFGAHYLPPDETFRNDGTHLPPYFSDNLLAAECVLDQIRAAGIGVKLAVKP